MSDAIVRRIPYEMGSRIEIDGIAYVILNLSNSFLIDLQQENLVNFNGYQTFQQNCYANCYFDHWALTEECYLFHKDFMN